MIGQTISHYKILEKLGEGGMGVVYKAQDLDLDRLVAIKSLPERLLGHDTEQQRFIQEAKAVSALNHPHVCTIHEFLKADDRQYIVMEYVDGRTLREVIRSGVPEQGTAINYAVQIGEALEEAHAKSIVHRDVKPENIMVNSKNQIKVMDFGLAKLKGSLKLTRTSSTVGTLSYMAPEQIEGKEVDARSDIFSFGIVLYELLSGHIPFRGEHEAALMYSILNEEPEPMEHYRSGVPSELLHILSRALEKDPEERYQSVHEMLIELRRLKKVSTRVVRPGSGEGGGVTHKERHSFINRNKIPLATALLIIGAMAVYLLLREKGPGINPDFTQRTIPVPMKDIGHGGISPDGRYIVFPCSNENKNVDLYIASVASGETRRLTNDDDSISTGWPRVSPDGSHIVYVRGSADICVVPFIGGKGKKIGTGVRPRWSPDGKKIGYILEPPPGSDYSSHAPSASGRGEFWTMNPDGTENHLEFIDTIGAIRYFSFFFAWAPDGRSVAWERSRTTYSEIVLHDLKTHKETPLATDSSWKSDLCWSSNNQIIYSSVDREGVNLWTIPGGSGIPMKITKGSNTLDYPTVSGDGRVLAFKETREISHLMIASLDNTGRRSEVTSDQVYYEYIKISPDGRQIAYDGSLPYSAQTNVYVITRDGSNRRQLTFGERWDSSPLWSPDGRLLAYNSRRTAEPPESTRTYVVSTEKSETPRLLHLGYLSGWRDNATLEVTYHNKVWTVPVDGGIAHEFSADSILAKSVLQKKYVLFKNLHKGSDSTLRVCRSEDWDGKGPAKSWAIWKGPTNGLGRDQGLYVFDPEMKLLLISLPDGKQKKISATFPGIDLYRFAVHVTADGKEMAYRTVEYSNKLMVIENLFQ